MPRPAFIASISANVVEKCKGTHLFPSLMISQACLESADGASGLSANYHNYYGMKSGLSWKGKVVELLTTEYVHGVAVKEKQLFRVYSSFADCFTDHVLLLQRVPVYARAGLFKATTPELQAKCLFEAGYATDPKYPSKLIAIINENNLKQYDGYVE